MTLEIRNEYPLGCLFHLYNFTLNSSLKYLVSRCEDMNAKHRKDGRYMKMDILYTYELGYLGKRFV